MKGSGMKFKYFTCAYQDEKIGILGQNWVPRDSINVSVLRVARLFRIFRVVKLSKHNESLKTMLRLGKLSTAEMTWFISSKSGPPQFNTSVPHKRTTPFQPRKSLSSIPKTRQFHTLLSSTPKTPQFQTPLSSTNPCVELSGF